MMFVDVRCKIPKHVTQISLYTEIIIFSVLLIHLPNIVRPNFKLANIVFNSFSFDRSSSNRQVT